VLSAVVIATGLALISRGLGNQLKAIRTVQEYEGLLAFARGKLLTLEAERLSSAAPTPAPQRGAFQSRDGAGAAVTYRWEMKVTPLPDLGEENDSAIFSGVTLTVTREGVARAPLVALSAIWTTAWVPDEWN
jgi:hypothetical protein